MFENMLKSLLIGVIGIVALMLVWMVVQHFWGTVFADHLTDEDVLAGRRQCGDCGCGRSCRLN